MQTILVVIHLFLALGIIGLVLIQHGKGADAGAAFGSGASATVFGARGSTSFLSHATAVLASLFFASSLALAYYASQTAKPTGIMDQMPAPEPQVVTAPPTANPVPVANNTQEPVIPPADVPQKNQPPVSEPAPKAQQVGPKSVPKEPTVPPVVTTDPKLTPNVAPQVAPQPPTIVKDEAGSKTAVPNASGDADKTVTSSVDTKVPTPAVIPAEVKSGENAPSQPLVSQPLVVAPSAKLGADEKPADSVKPVATSADDLTAPVAPAPQPAVAPDHGKTSEPTPEDVAPKAVVPVELDTKAPAAAVPPAAEAGVAPQTGPNVAVGNGKPNGTGNPNAGTKN